MKYKSQVPFNDALLAMLGDISKTILKSPQARRAPQYVALAYWLRPASLLRIKESLIKDDAQRSELRTARGVALHLPPTNVDTLFVYSWALAVMAGNANITRLSASLSAETEWLVHTIAKIVDDHGEAQRQIFCSYPYGGDAEQSLSLHCDLRMIWGGDEKVTTVSKTPIRPDGLSIGFPNRKSLAIISAAAYEKADESSRDELARQFYNDLFWFDQMGCGSPRMLIWLNAQKNTSSDFYTRLENVIVDKEFAVETGTAISKLAFGNDLLAQGVSDKQIIFSNEFSVCQVKDPQSALMHIQGGGFLHEWLIEDISEVPPIISRDVQTITHFGLSDSVLHELAHGIAGRGGYRIVPVGEALQFDTIWDGVELFEHMTRKIVIRKN